jgi:hypothetical protein
MNLLDALKASSNKSPALEPSNVKAQTESVLTTKLTGQAAPVTSIGPATSSQAERMGLQETKQQLEQGALTGRLQDVVQMQQSEAQEAGLKREERSIGESIKMMQQDFETRTESLLNDTLRSREELSQKDLENKMENIGQLMRLQNTKYIDQLQMAGNEKRLRDGISAREELLKTQMRDGLAFLNDDLAYKKIAGATQREWETEMANMDINFAIQMTQRKINDEMSRQKYEGISGLISGGAQAYDARSEKAALDRKDK